MSVFSLSVHQKRQAIELGLAAYIEDRSTLERALAHWEAHYQDKPMYVLNRFIYDVCDEPHLRAQRNVILRALMAEMVRLEKHDTDLDTTAHVTHSTNETIKLRHGMIIILQSFFQATSPNDQSVLQQIYAARLTKVMKLKVSIILEDLATQYWTHLLEAEQYLRVINLMYEVYCEFYGPIQADHVLSQARLKLKRDEPSLDLSALL